MTFYSLTKEQRVKHVAQIKSDILSDIQKNSLTKIITYFSDEDTYIRKSAYLSVGRIYAEHPVLQKKVISVLTRLLKEEKNLPSGKQ